MRLTSKTRPLGALLSFFLVGTATSAEAPINFNFPYEATEPVPWKATVDADFIKETVLKASLYRPSIDLLDSDEANSNWEEGPDGEFMTDLAKYWSEEYDWAKVEDEIFSNFSHYAITIPDGGFDYDHPVSFHFIHERSNRSDAIPLLMLHGWPSSHLEFSKVIESLVSPKDPDAQAFHVIVPDLPGFGFSPAPRYSNFGCRQVGATLDKLMHKLGYEEYGLVGTDFGHFISLHMGMMVPESIIGYYTDFWLIEANATDLERYANNETTTEETAYISSIQDFMRDHYVIGPTHSMRPLGVSQVFTDSPVGYAGWVYQLMELVSDSHPYTLQDIVTDTMMLYIQGTYGNIRYYREVFMNDIMLFEKTNMTTATGLFGMPTSPHNNFDALVRAPESWIARFVEVEWVRDHGGGGHFPSVSRPDVWTKDVRDFFEGLSSN